MSTDEVKRLVARVFFQFGAKTVFDIKETLFLDNGKCLAVTYRTDDLSAVWCLADDIVEFRRDGKMLRTVRLLNEEALSSAAA